MNRISLIIAFIALWAYPALSQVDRTKPPVPGPAPKFNMGEFTEFSLENGLKVILVENHKTPRISYQLFIDRVPMIENDKVGLGSITGDMLAAGTKNMDKVKLDEEIGFYGARFFTASNMIYMSGLSRHKKELISLLADVTLNPTFPKEELDKIKRQTLSGLEAGKEDPSSISNNLRSKVVYGDDHPYGEVQKPEHLENINTTDCKAYYEKFFTPQSAYLVVVGDISIKEAKATVKDHFGNWQGHKLVKGVLDMPKPPATTKVSFAHKSGAVQSVISVTYPVDNKPGSAHEISAEVMNAILGGSSFGARLMQNLREDKAYTYGCRSSLTSNPHVATFSASASVRNEVTAGAIQEILFEMNRMIDEKVKEEELSRVKSSIKGSFSRNLENPQTIASFALNISRFNLPKDYYNDYLKKVEAVSLSDVQEAAKLYLRPKNAHIVVVGDGVSVAPTLTQFGSVDFYDAFGDPTTPPGFELPEGTSAVSVLEKALKAFGGKDKIAGVKDYTITVEGEGPMGKLEIKRMALIKKGWFYQSMWMGENVLSTMKVYKGDFYISGPQGKQEVTEEQKSSLLGSIPLHEEILLIETPEKLRLIGGEYFKDQKAAVIEVVDGASTQKRFYSIETGFLLGTSEVSGEREVVWEYDEYTNYSGILMPKLSKNSGMPFTFSISKAEINQGVDKKKFKF